MSLVNKKMVYDSDTVRKKEEYKPLLFIVTIYGSLNLYSFGISIIKNDDIPTNITYA